MSCVDESGRFRLLGRACRTPHEINLGRRVEKTWTAATVQSVYGPLGNLLALMNGQTFQEARFPLVGGTVARYQSGTTGPTSYWHPDWLGTSRLESTPSRTLGVDAAFAPFGEQYVYGNPFDSIFTGAAPHDKATDLWDFPAREYHPTQGRWITPDPAGLAAVDATDPQTWNRYAYVRNNPLALIDTNGLGGDCAPGATLPCTVTGTSSSLSDLDQLLFQIYSGWYCGVLGICNQHGGGPGTTGGGGGKSTGVVQKVKRAYCSALPEGRTEGVAGTLGIIGGATGSVERLVNYNTGEVSGFVSGGFQGGYNGGASVSIETGFVYNLGNSNSAYSGGFTTASASYATPVPFTSVGVFTSASSGGFSSTPASAINFSPGGAKVVGISTSAALFGRYGFGVSATNYSQPIALGNMLTNPASSPLAEILDVALYVSRQVCQ